MLPPKYLSVKDVALLLGVSVKTVYKHIEETPGHLMYGSIHLFDAEELYKGLKDLVLKKTASKRQKGRTDNRHNL